MGLEFAGPKELVDQVHVGVEVIGVRLLGDHSEFVFLANRGVEVHDLRHHLHDSRRVEPRSRVLILDDLPVRLHVSVERSTMPG